MSGKKVYLIDGKRTPFGKFGGGLSEVTPVDLAVHCSKELLTGQNISPDKIDHVILGNVVPSSTDAMYGGRHLALKLGAPITTPGYCLNRLCGSGIQAILDAARLIKLDEANLVLAAGTENMSMVPHLVYGGRFGTRYGELKNVDMLLDALTDKFANIPMAITAENLSEKFEVSRAESDEYSFLSHTKAAKAYEQNLLQGEIVPYEHRKGVIDCDEHIRPDVSLDDMKKLRPAFKKDGIVTPGSASGVVDGAAAVLVASETFVKENNLKPLAEIVDGHVVGVDPTIMGIGPSPAITQLLQKNSMKLSDIDLIEINEAFAGQLLSCAKDLKIDNDKLNVWGGAVAIGHPLAATGTRISLTLSRQLKHYGKEYGIASACIGGGQGIAVLLKSC